MGQVDDDALYVGRCSIVAPEGTTNNYRPPSATFLTHLADVLRGENRRLLDVADTLFLPVVLPCLRPEPGAVRGLNMPVMSV